MLEFYLSGVSNVDLNIRMGEGFLSEFLKPFPMKEYVTNENKRENGRWIDFRNTKDVLEATLPFVIMGDNSLDLARGVQALDDHLVGSDDIEVVNFGKRKYEYHYKTDVKLANNTVVVYAKMTLYED